jgi:hypothetical protein
MIKYSEDIFSILLKLITFILSFFVSIYTFAEVISVEQIEKGFLVNSNPTNTLYWKGINSKALLLLIPGGKGNLNLKPKTTNVRLNFFQSLQRLTNPELTW